MFTRRVILNIKPGYAAEAGTETVSVCYIFESESEAVAAFSRPLLDTEGQLLSYEHARYQTHS
jgi:hypothetical protein